MISELLLIRAKLRENIQYSSESEDNSEGTTELAVNQTQSVENVAWLRFWLGTEFAWELCKGNICRIKHCAHFSFLSLGLQDQD